MEAGDGQGSKVNTAARLEKVRAALLYAALTIEIAVVIVDKSELHDPYESYIFRVTFVMTLLAVLLGDYTRREWGVIAAAAVFGFFCYRMTGRNEILRVVIFVAACKGRAKTRMLRTAFWETAAGCAAIALLSLSGLYGARAMTATFRQDGQSVVRYCFGFGHPNALHCMFYMLVLMALLIWEKRLKALQYLVLFLGNAGLYLLTDSQTGFSITALTIVAACLLHFDDAGSARRRGTAGNFRTRKWPYVISAIVVLLCVVFSVWAAYISYYMWTGDGVASAQFMDRLLHGRLTDLFWAEEKAGISSWSLFSSSTAQRYFDMGWCRLYYWYGIIPATLAVIMVLLLIRICSERRDAMLLIAIVSAAVYTVEEAHLISVYIGRNFFLLIYGAIWSEIPWLKIGSLVGISRFLRGKRQVS